MALENTPNIGARYDFMDNGIGYRGGYPTSGVDSGLLAAVLLSRGGHHDHCGHHHRCSNLDEAQAILDKLNSQDVENLVHDVRNSLAGNIKDAGDRVSERVKDTRDDISDRIRDSKDCVSERLSGVSDRLKDNIDCVKEGVRDFRQDFRQYENRFDGFQREFCDFKSETRAGLSDVKGLIKETALVQELRDTKDKLDNERRLSDRQFLSKKLNNLEDDIEDDIERSCGRRRSRGGDCGRDLSIRDLAELGFRLVPPVCPSTSNGTGNPH